jgi:hypothetical protein
MYRLQRCRLENVYIFYPEVRTERQHLAYDLLAPVQMNSERASHSHNVHVTLR